MSTDPWCKKCPFLMECIEYEIDPLSMSCETNRLRARHLDLEGTWLDDPVYTVTFEYPQVTFK